MEKITGTYMGNGIFSLMPTYDETATYDFSKNEFLPSANIPDNEIDYDAMYENHDFQKDLIKHHVNNKHTCA